MKKAVYRQVAERVRGDIARNVFGGPRLPNEQVLMARYGVSRLTLHRAMRVLAGEGTIDRVQGKGSFIRGRNQEMTMARQIALLMGGRGHFRMPLYDAVIGAIIDAGCYCVAAKFDPSEASADTPDDRSERLHGLLGSPIRGVIAVGEAYYHYPFMRDYEDLDAVFLITFDSHDPLPGRGVFCDFEAAAKLATEHLLRLGHQRIALVDYESEETAHPVPDSSAESHSDTLLERGYRRTMEAAGGAPPRVLYACCPADRHGERFPEVLREVLTAPEPPTALVCDADIHALRAMQVALDLGLRVPEDLAVVGMYDTPWCQEAPVPLTSVSYQPELLGETAVAVLLDTEGKYPQVTVIPPKLVIRASCGGNLSRKADHHA